MSGVDLRILKRARERITDARFWCTRTWAKRLGRPVEWTSSQADQFCALGSLGRATLDIAAEDGLDISASDAALRAVALGTAMTKPGERSIVSINDYHGHQAVLEKFDEAIAKREKEDEANGC